MTTSEPPRGALTLYVSGASALSARAIGEATRLCDVHLGGRFDLAVVDVHEDSAPGSGGQVIATPTLIKNRPLPERRLVGDLSDAARVLQALGLARSAPPRQGAT